MTARAIFLSAITVATLVLTGARLVRAQSSLGAERRDLDHLRGDVWSTWTAPARIDRRAIVPGAVVIAALATIATEDSALYVWMTTHPDAWAMRLLGPMRERWRFPLYELGSGQMLLPLSALAYGAGRLSHDRSLRDAGLGCAAAHLSSAGLREIIYLSISRSRPRVTSSPWHFGIPGRRDWSEHSFLSGHVANSMSCASFLAHRYHAGLLAPLMYVSVSAIGLGRVADGRHWVSDSMAGAVMGFAIGKLIADRQQIRNAADRERRTAPAAPAFRIAWTLTF